MFSRFVKGPDRSLSKRVRLSPKAFHYRLALEYANFQYEEIALDGYYEGFKDVLNSRDKFWLWNGLTTVALFLYVLGTLEDFDIFGISTDPSVLGYLIFIIFSLSVLLFAIQQAKVVRYQSLFNAVHDHGLGARKQHLILKYPRAYSPLIYANWMSGGPRFMFPAKRLPIRVVLLLLAMIPALVAWMGFSLWLLASVSLQLWQEDAPALGGWAKILVLSGWALIVGSLLLPTVATRKLEFDHYGLSQTLEKVRQKSLPRYRRYLSLIDRTGHGRKALRGDQEPGD